MRTQPSCPGAALLREHLEGLLPEPEQAALVEHLDGCSDCQRALEVLAAGGGELLEATRHLDEGLQERRHALCQVLAGPQPTPGPSDTAPVEGTDEPSALAFLGPSERPDCLGTLGPYEVLGVIGRGGMGVVLRAIDPALGRLVAVKVMAPQLAASAEARRRFAREARAGAAVHHEHVVAIHAVDEAGGLPYLVMEHVAGPSLAQRLAGGARLDVREAVRIGLETAAGLQAAHAQGVVHRDVKPANVLLSVDLQRTTDNGQRTKVKLTDFGLARAAGDATVTQSGTVAGTPRYMAPEQARGDPVDHRADVYGLGVTLYEALTGRPAFEGDGPLEVMRSVVSAEPVPPRRLNPAIPVDLETVILKATAKAPAERYATVEELAADLRCVLEDRSVRARRPTLLQRLQRWVRRHRPLVVTSSAALVAVLAVTTTALAVSNVRIKRALSAEVEAEKELHAALEREKDTVYLSQVALADREWWANNVARAEQLLADCDPDRRRWEWHYLRRRGRTQAVTLGFGGHAVMAPPVSPDGRYVAARSRTADEGHRFSLRVWEVATGRVALTLPARGMVIDRIRFSADGRRLITSEARGSLHVWDLENGRQMLRLNAHKTRVQCAGLSPDGAYLLSGVGRGLTVWDTGTGAPIRELDGVWPGDWNSLAFSPDGEEIAVAAGAEVVLVELRTGREVRRLAGHSNRVNCLAFGAAGEHLASGSRDGSVRLWHARTGRLRMVLSGHTEEVLGVAFSLDGRLVAAGGSDRTVRIWDTHSGRTIRTFRGHHNDVKSLAFLLDSRRLVTASADGTVRTWDCDTTQGVGVLYEADGPLFDGALSPDGRRLALAAGRWQADGRFLGGDLTVIVWDVTARVELFRLVGHAGVVHSVAFSPDGGRVLTAGADGTVRVWDAETGQLVHTFRGHALGAVEAVYSPDGRTVASASRDGTVRLWDATTGQALRTLQVGPPVVCWGLVFTADGERLAGATSDGIIRLWDVTTASEAFTLTGHKVGIIHQLVLTPDGRRLASASHDGTVRIWELSTGRGLLVMAGHGPQVHGVAFTPDGQRLASVGSDAIVRLWDATRGQEILSLGHQPRVMQFVGFSPDGHRLITACQDGKVRLWDGTPLEK